MTFLQTPISLRTYSRFAGLLYLIIAIVGGLSIAYMPSLIIVPDNAAVTANNIIKHYDIFRMGIAGDIVVLLLEVVLTVFLYRIFKRVNKSIALVAALSRMAMSIVMGLNLLNYLIPIILLKNTSLMAGFDPDQLNSLALLFLKAHKYGEFIWQIFFSLHLVALGYLVIKCGFVPKFLGYLMFIGSFGYGGESISQILLLDGQFLSITNGTLLFVATMGELIFTFWLLIRGIKPGHIGSRD